MAVTTFASITIGSSEISMKIYEMSSSRRIKQMDNIRYPMELGIQTYSTGRLSFDTVNCICDRLKDFRNIGKEYGVSEYIAIATSAIREAKNSILILDRIKLITGLDVKIISNSEQRFLCYKAIAINENAFSKTLSDNTLILDVGAGSIQISIFEDGELTATQNLKLGFQRVRDILSDIEDRVPSYISLLREFISNDINTFKRHYLVNTDIKNIIVVSDNSYELNRIFRKDNEFIDKSQFIDILNRIENLSGKQLSQKYGITGNQVYDALPISIIIDKLLEVSNAQNLWFPQVKVNDGIAVDYAIKKMKFSLQHDFTQDTLSCARLIAKKYNCNSLHNKNVEENAIKIFDSLYKLHGLGRKERQLLQIAVILHSCGEFINMNEASYNSHNIIMGTEIIGLSHNEREMVANIVDYNFENVSNENISAIKICKLAAIFRLANALDKSHKQKINCIKVTVTDKVLSVAVKTDKDIILEKCFFNQQSKYFAMVYGIIPELVQKLL